MLNSCVIVGQAAGQPVLLKDKSKRSDRNYGIMKIECDAAFRTPEGNLRKEVFDVLLWRGIAEECAAALRKGTTVAVRGHLTSVPVEKNGEVHCYSMIVAEKVAIDRSTMDLNALGK